jgi:hypothetical protein
MAPHLIEHHAAHVNTSELAARLRHVALLSRPRAYHHDDGIWQLSREPAIRTGEERWEIHDTERIAAEELL